MKLLRNEPWGQSLTLAHANMEQDNKNMCKLEEVIIMSNVILATGTIAFFKNRHWSMFSQIGNS
jgi:hypothetical protein